MIVEFVPLICLIGKSIQIPSALSPRISEQNYRSFHDFLQILLNFVVVEKMLDFEVAMLEYSKSRHVTTLGYLLTVPGVLFDFVGASSC
jgi:hypothetical protein